MDGLNPLGVPKKLKNSVFPFHYNNYEELLSIVEENNIGVIKMEVVRNFGPEDDFLEKVRELATKKNIVLIFDGVRRDLELLGILYKQYGVEPDMAMYGDFRKWIAQYYCGQKKVMESAQKTFISSTPDRE